MFSTRDLKLAVARVSVDVRTSVAPLREETWAKIPVLCYHRVLPDLQDGPIPSYTVLPEQFTAQLALLRREGFVSLSLTEYMAIATGQCRAPERAVLVTIDDGFADTYSVAWQIAREYGVTVNVFVCTGLLAGAPVTIYDRSPSGAIAHQARLADLWRPLGWGELREMVAAGCGLGFHSHLHRPLSSLSCSDLRADLTHGVEILIEQFGQQPFAFAFPKGGVASYNQHVIEHLKRAKFSMLFTTCIGRTPLPTPGPLFQRLPVHQQDSLETFRHKLLGGYDWVGRLRTAVASRTRSPKEC